MFSFLSGAAVDPDFPQEIKERALQGINKKQQWQVKEKKKITTNQQNMSHLSISNKQLQWQVKEKRKQRQINKRCPTFQFLHHNKDPLWRFEHSLQVDNTLKKS